MTFSFNCATINFLSLMLSNPHLHLFFLSNNALTSPSSFFSSLSSSPFPVPSLFYLALLSLLSFGFGKLDCSSFLLFFSLSQILFFFYLPVIFPISPFSFYFTPIESQKGMQLIPSSSQLPF